MWVERDAWIIRLVDADGRVGLGEAVLESEHGEVADTILTALIREAVDERGDGRLPTMAELEVHGRARPGAERRARRARGSTSTARRPELRADGDGVGVNATLPSLGPAAVAEARPAVGRIGVRDAQAQGRRRARDRGPRRAGPRGPGGGRSGRAATARRQRRLGPRDRRGPARGARPRSTSSSSSSRWPAHDLDGAGRAATPGPGPDRGRRGRRVGGGGAELLDAEAVDVLVVKPARVGGPEVGAEIAALAAARGVPVVVSTLFETGVGIAAALAMAAALPVVGGAALGDALDHGLATAGLLEHDLLCEWLVVDRRAACGYPMRRGLAGSGIEPDEEAVARYRAEARGAAVR